MELTSWNVKHPFLYLSPTNLSCSINNKDKEKSFLRFNNYPFQFHHFNNNFKSCSLTILTHAKKKNNSEPKIIEEEVSDDIVDDDEDFDDENDGVVVDDDFEDDEEFVDDGEYFEDELVTETAEVYAGDGAEGGGISLAGTWWDKEALALAENVAESCDGDLGIYAFRTLVNGTIQVRIEKLSTKSGSPNMSDIEVFSAAYSARLDEAENAKTIPENYSLEVSSPGVERVIRIPQELDRFKERPMYVKYITEVEATALSSEKDGVFRLVSFDLETKSCTWGLADVRINREKAGKGRPMSKKQRDWRLTTPFDSIRLVRIYSEC